MSSRAAFWWAQSSSRAQATTAAFTVLSLVLVGVSYYVWSSPAIAPVRAVVDQAVAAADPLAAQNAALTKALAGAQLTIASQKGKLSALQQQQLASQASAAKKLATLQQRAASAEGRLGAATSQLAAANAADAAAQAARAAAASAKAATAGLASGKPVSSTDPGPAPIVAPAKAALLTPAGRYFGMYTEQAPFNWATFDATSAKIGVAPNLVGYFSGWDEDFRADAVQRAWANGRLPLMTWESRPIKDGNDTTVAPDYSLPKIIDGSFDAYLHQYAKDIVATGLPLAIRLDHEMNGTWYPWSESDGAGKSINGNSPGDYVTMWRHVHDIFQQEGANSLVIWLWSPNIVNNLPASHQGQDYLTGYYPGDDYVDWVGLSGYLRPPYQTGNDFSFSYTFDRSLDQLRTLTKKPILLSEIGASETGGHKPTWVTSLFDGFSKPENADIIGFSWFDLAVTSYTQGVRATNDWRIDSRPDSLSAFIDGITRPEDDFTLTPAP